MANIRPVDDKGELIIATPDKVDKFSDIDSPKSHGLEGGEPLQDVLIKSVEQMVGLDTYEERARYQPHINTLLEWAKQQTKDHTPENIKWVIRQLEMRIGTPPIGEKLVSRLSRIAYLEMETKKMNEEIKSYTVS